MIELINVEVEKRCLEVWGTEEALEEAIEKKEEQREVSKQKKFKKKMKGKSVSLLPQALRRQPCPYLKLDSSVEL